MATISGTTSELTGGKFANGAVTGAFVHMFNTYGTDPINKLAYGDPKEMADAQSNASDFFAFVSLSKIPIISKISGILASFAMYQKHMLLIEANSFKDADFLLDVTLDRMPMPTKYQKYILDTTTSKGYDYIENKYGNGK